MLLNGYRLCHSDNNYLKQLTNNMSFKKALEVSLVGLEQYILVQPFCDIWIILDTSYYNTLMTSSKLIRSKPGVTEPHQEIKKLSQLKQEISQVTMTINLNETKTAVTSVSAASLPSIRKTLRKTSLQQWRKCFSTFHQKHGPLLTGSTQN